LGNVVSGLIGGLPVTQVIVRSSANIAFGARSKLSAIIHGVLLLLSAVTIASYLNMIPLASLATILLIVGYKLAKPSLFKETYQQGWQQFIPFIVTILAILLTDLLKGITLGLIVGVCFTLYHRLKLSHSLKDVVTDEDGHEIHHIELSEQVTFFNKASIVDALENIPADAKVTIDCSKTKVMDYDVTEVIKNYQAHAKLKDIQVEVVGLDDIKLH